MPAIKGTFQAIYSNRNMYGNVYQAFIYTDNATGKQVKALSNNVDHIWHYMDRGDWMNHRGRYTVIETWLPIREFNRLTKNWPYGGNGDAQTAAFIKASLRRK